MVHQIEIWVGFNVFVFILLALDLGVFNRKAHEIGIKEALVWSVVWTVLALIFNAGIYYYRGHDAGLKFFTGYLLERVLSFDNLFVFLIVFSYFNVPPKYQHRVLFWGILGALIMRAIFIVFGITLIHMFHGIIYIFGLILLVTGFKLAFQKEKEFEPEKNPMLKLLRKVMPITSDYVEGKFCVKRDGRTCATPLLVVLLIIETTDVIFAVDSIPAILAITTDPFIVYTSNVFAILGLRALYFALAALMKLFHYLNYGLSFILVFIGVKMLISDIYKIPIEIALGTIVCILLISIAASIAWPKKVK